MGDRRVLAVADDLTGALEVGARFAEHGLEATVVTGGEMPAARVAVVDTETRHVGVEAAAAAVRAAVGGGGVVSVPGVWGGGARGGRGGGGGGGGGRGLGGV